MTDDEMIDVNAVMAELLDQVLFNPFVPKGLEKALVLATAGKALANATTKQRKEYEASAQKLITLMMDLAQGK